METLGNKTLLGYRKTGFLASGHINVGEVMPLYEWATKRGREGECVMSGFSSKMERDVLDFLLEAKTPIIWVLARRMYRRLPPSLQSALEERRLLVVSTCEASRQSKENARKRNLLVAERADSLVFAGLTRESSLYPIYRQYREKAVLPEKDV